MVHKLVFYGKFNGLNEFIDANRRGKGRYNAGNEMKKKDQQVLAYLIKKQFKKDELIPKVFIKYHFYEKDKKRDMDNVSGYFRKVFQDALVTAGYLKNDGWRYIRGSSEEFDTDKQNPRIEVEIIDG